MSDSDDDWFNKDENEIIQSLEQQVKQQQVLKGTHEERIELHSSYDNKLKQIYLEVSKDANESKAPGRFTTAQLAKALTLAPLDMFLYFMSEHRNLFLHQIVANDSLKRIQQYVEVLTIICQLELGGFDNELLSGFAQQTALLNHIKRFALALFQPPSKGNLDKDTEKMFRGIKWLLIRAHKVGVLGELGYELVEHFKSLIKGCQVQHLLKHQLCIELAEEFEVLPSVICVKNNIYPTLDNLLQPKSVDLDSVDAATAPGDVTAYLHRQRRLLCDDFMQPLIEFVKLLKTKTNINALIEQHLLWPQTQLNLNPKFKESDRHSLIFMDIRPEGRRDGNHLASNHEVEYLRNIKTGSLLCFTSSYDFDNLVLATVGYTDTHNLRQGFLSVEITKQYNIGNLYGKPLIMFETPVFFEPYLRVYNYLSTCGADNFPMRRYIVENQLEIQPPLYIKPNAKLTYNGKSFTAAKLDLKAELNNKQQSAIGAALSSEFCLIQGPPGTGKTHLAVELVDILLQNAAALKTGPIIVIAYTNDSLDKFLLKAAQRTDSILRFGSQTRFPQIAKFNVRTVIDDELIPPQLKRIWWLVKCEYKEQFERLQVIHNEFDGSEEPYMEIQSALEKLQLIAEKINTLRNIFQYYVARDKSLLAMTTTCAARLNFLFRLLQSKCYVFEEAAETAEAHVLASLTPYTQHVILIGDHKQLQPYTGNHTQQGLQVSLFERLITHKFPATVLNVQFRMRSCIAELLVPCFYEELISDVSVDSYGHINKMAADLYFVDHNQPEEQLTDMSFVNKYEAQELVKLVVKLPYKCKDIVILSPYNAQVEYIKKLLQKKKKSNIPVSSVDSYQGLEANIVLLSLVRSNPNGQVGFLRQPNRICVALSRARWGLYIIGNMETWIRGNYKLWSTINYKLKAANAIGEAFPFSN